MNWRTALLAATGAFLVVTAMLAEPIPQDPAYHQFIDNRALLGIPNFSNVASNIGFLIVGVAALWIINQRKPRNLGTVWLMLAIGVIGTALGSTYYHWAPSNESLAWDRLGMVIGFMSLAALVIGEYGSPETARRLLWPLILIGIMAVIYWSHTEALGQGDLRPYAVVQFLPAILIVMTLLLFPQNSDLTPALWWLFLFYLLAKASEHFDEQIFAAGSLISGHSLKHLFAAAGLACLFNGLRRRTS